MYIFLLFDVFTCIVNVTFSSVFILPFKDVLKAEKHSKLSHDYKFSSNECIWKNGNVFNGIVFFR